MKHFMVATILLFFVPPAHAGISHVASSSAYQLLALAETPAEITVNKPTGTVDGHVMIAQVCNGDTNAVTEWTAPAGWTEIFNIFDATSTDSTTAVFYKVASSEGANYTFVSDGNALNYATVIISSFSGCDVSGVPLDVTWNQSNHWVKYTSDTTPASPSITTTTDGALVICGIHVYQTNKTNTLSPPSGYTTAKRLMNLDEYVGCQQGITYKTKPSAGSESPGDWNLGSLSRSIPWIIALKPDLTPSYLTTLLDFKLEIQSFQDSIRGLGNNLIWEDQFTTDLENWTDLSGGTLSAEISTDYSTSTYMASLMYLEANASYAVSAERGFSVESTDDWIIEFELAYNTGDEGKFEVLNSADDVLALFEFGTVTDTISFSTDVETAETGSFIDGRGEGKQCIISYNHLTDKLCFFRTAPSADTYVIEQIGSAKEITPATDYKIRFTAYAGAVNEVYVGRCIVYHPQLILIGASITQSVYVWCNAPSYWLARADWSGAWSYLWSKMYSECWMGNRAYGGSSASTAVTDGVVANALKEKPTHVYMSYGHNDIMGGRTVTQMKSDFTTLLNQIHSAGVTGKNVIIGNVVATDMIDGVDEVAKREEFNAWLEEKQAEEGYLLFDLYELTVDPSDPDGMSPDIEGADGTHPDAEGYQIIADAMYEFFENPYSWWYPMLVH